MKDLGEHGAAKLAEIESRPYLEQLGEFVSRLDAKIPENEIKWPFKKVLTDHLIVRIADPPKEGTIIMPQKNKDNRPTKGIVIAIDPEIKDIQLGDVVLYSQFAGYLLRFARLPLCRCMGYSEILAILNEDAPEIESEG